MVRCPVCKTVFAPGDSAPPEPEEDEDEEETGETETEREPPKKRKPARREATDDDGDDDDRPQKKKKKKTEDEEDRTKNRDFDPITEEEDRRRRRRKRQREADDQLSPEEKAARRAAFIRAAVGVKLIWISFGLFMLSMFVIVVFFFQTTFRIVVPAYIVAAGILGLVNWILAAIGVGLCLSGPRAPGFLGYGIAAAVAVVVHAIFLMAVVSQKSEFAAGQIGADTNLEGLEKWGRIPTRIDATMFYLTMVFYHEHEGFTPRGKFLLSMIAGLLEMVRTVLIMMLLSCLARSALDEDLAHKCTRAAGVASFGPGIVAMLMLATVASLVETNAGLNLFTLILILVVLMSVYAILIAVMMPSFLAAREVADACDEPFQSLIPQL